MPLLSLAAVVPGALRALWATFSAPLAVGAAHTPAVALPPDLAP
ncbi:hypothetical protein [Streptomyces griseus]|nr:hypothetical protein [Streptomyces griseus]